MALALSTVAVLLLLLTPLPACTAEEDTAAPAAGESAHSGQEFSDTECATKAEGLAMIQKAQVLSKEPGAQTLQQDLEEAAHVGGAAMAGRHKLQPGAHSTKDDHVALIHAKQFQVAQANKTTSKIIPSYVPLGTIGNEVVGSLGTTEETEWKCCAGLYRNTGGHEYWRYTWSYQECPTGFHWHHKGNYVCIEVGCEWKGNGCAYPNYHTCPRKWYNNVDRSPLVKGSDSNNWKCCLLERRLHAKTNVGEYYWRLYYVLLSWHWAPGEDCPTEDHDDEGTGVWEQYTRASCEDHECPFEGKSCEWREGDRSLRSTSTSGWIVYC